MARGIYRMEVDCGRHGCLSGLFSADSEITQKLISSCRDIHFGEVLGKHSSVKANFGENDGSLDLVTDDPIAVEIFDKYDFSSGYNPFDYVDEDWNEDDDEEK